MPKFKFTNSTMVILMLIMLVNALSYGTIIPLLYPYSSRFGINPQGLSLLFASFSLAQFIATPIIGRLSDKWGRKPLLLLSLFGTAISLALFASAKTAEMLFVARIFDGITGGNISVAQAVVADTTKGEERAKGFGMLGAAFGFGFLLGPAIGGILSRWGITAPFWFASVLALTGTILGIFFLKETAAKTQTQTNEPLFRFRSIFEALLTPLTGIILVISFISIFSLHSFIIGFQSFTVDVLKLDAFRIGILFTVAGLVNVLMQSVGIRVLINKIPSRKKILQYSLIGSTIVMTSMYFIDTLTPFIVAVMLHMAAFAPQNPIIAGFLSENTKQEDQGGILGINQSYVSLGQIAGPLAAGFISIYSIRNIFLLSAVTFLLALFATHWLPKKSKKLDL